MAQNTSSSDPRVQHQEKPPEVAWSSPLPRQLIHRAAPSLPTMQRNYHEAPYQFMPQLAGLS